LRLSVKPSHHIERWPLVKVTNFFMSICQPFLELRVEMYQADTILYLPDYFLRLDQNPVFGHRVAILFNYIALVGNLHVWFEKLKILHEFAVLIPR